MFSFFKKVKKERAARAAEAAKAAAEVAAWRAGDAERNRAAAQRRAAYVAQQSAPPQHDAHVQKYRTHKALQQVIQRMRESAREYRVAKYREASATSVDYRTEATEPPFPSAAR